MSFMRLNFKDSLHGIILLVLLWRLLGGLSGYTLPESALKMLLAGAADPRGGQSGSIGFLNYSHPIFELFKAPRSGDFSAAHIFRYRALQPNPGDRVIARYDDAMPGWQFQSNDQFHVADFDGDGKKDLYVFNGNNWAIPYVGLLRSSGTGFNVVQRYDANMPGWQMRPGDRHVVGDFSGEGREDLWVFNGSNWSIPYLGMLRSNGTSLLGWPKCVVRARPSSMGRSGYRGR